MMQNQKEDKNHIRQLIKEQRRLLEQAEKQADKSYLDDQILRHLMEMPVLQRLREPKHAAETAAVPVYCYMSVHGETDTRNLISFLWSQKIPVAVPRVEGQRIRFYRISSMADLVPGCMGIPEPSNDCEPADNPEAAVITPGLAFSPDGARIGYGGGFYDRFFAEEPEHLRIAAAYGFQIFPDLPVDSLDKKVDWIVTEDRVYHCSRRNADREQEDGLWN